MRMEMYMTEIGEMTKRTEKENILMQTELFTMETGWMIGSMDSEQKVGPMEQGMKANMWMGKRKAKELCTLQMDLFSKAISKATK